MKIIGLTIVKTIGTGLLVSSVGAYLIILFLRKNWIPDFFTRVIDINIGIFDIFNFEYHSTRFGHINGGIIGNHFSQSRASFVTAH